MELDVQRCRRATGHVVQVAKTLWFPAELIHLRAPTCVLEKDC